MIMMNCLKKKPNSKNIFFVFFIIFFLLQIDLYSYLNQPAEKNKILKFGILKNTFSGKNAYDAKAAFEIWTKNYIKENKEINVSVETVIYENISEVKKALQNDEVQFIHINTIDFLKFFSDGMLTCFLINSTGFSNNETSPLDKLVLLVSKRSGIKKISDLQNKKITIQSGKWADIPVIWLSTLLSSENIKINEKTIQRYDKSSQAVYRVYFKQNDACIVSENAYKTIIELNPNIGSEITSIASSDKLLPFIFCHTKSADPEIIDIIKKSVANFDKSNYGKQILTLFQTDKIMLFENKFIENTRKLYEKYRKINED